MRVNKDQFAAAIHCSARRLRDAGYESFAVRVEASPDPEDLSNVLCLAAHKAACSGEHDLEAAIARSIRNLWKCDADAASLAIQLEDQMRRDRFISRGY